ncbi:hypothetical protein CLOM_g7557, partial [Closterium sp. NIES-68]
LAHAPGTGKTLTTIAFIEKLFSLHRLNRTSTSGSAASASAKASGSSCASGSAARILIVTELSIVDTWWGEFPKWIPQQHRTHIPSLKVIEGGGGLREAERLARAWAGREDGGWVRGEVRRIIVEETDVLICDEGHRIKSPSTISHRALDRLHTRRRLLLTGTPLQNSTLELWDLACFVQRPRMHQAVFGMGRGVGKGRGEGRKTQHGGWGWARGRECNRGGVIKMASPIEAVLRHVKRCLGVEGRHWVVVVRLGEVEAGGRMRECQRRRMMVT